MRTGSLAVSAMSRTRTATASGSPLLARNPRSVSYWNNDGVYDHEAIVTASDGADPDGTINWDLVDAHTNNRYHAYWTLAQYNASWATTRIVVLHIAPTTS